MSMWAPGVDKQYSKVLEVTCTGEALETSGLIT